MKELRTKCSHGNMVRMMVRPDGLTMYINCKECRDALEKNEGEFETPAGVVQSPVKPMNAPITGSAKEIAQQVAKDD